MNRDVATTILVQLGGNRFLAMTGAKNLVASPDALQFDLPRGFASNKATKVRVTLTDADLYRLDFYRWIPRKCWAEEISSTDGIFVDDLRRIFTEETGLDTSL